eukprot:419957_1
MSNNEKEYTWQEIAKHNTDESLWVYSDDKVYDVTKFIDRHPGGRDMLLLMAGRDLTDLFECYHPFTEKPKEMLKKFKIGKLKGSSEFASFKADSGFYKECREGVNKYFEDNNLDYKSVKAGILHYLLIITMIFSCWSIVWINPFNFSFILRIILMVTAGSFQGMLLIHTMHDCSHTAFSHKPFIWKLMGRLCLDLVCGCSFDAWLHQHVVGHHVYTNIIEIDPDCPMSKTDDVRRVMPSQRWSKLYKYQYIWLPIAYCIYSFKNRVQDLTQTLLGQYNGAMRVNPEFYNTESYIRQIVCKSFWFIRAIIVPIFYWNNSFFFEFVPLFLIMELTTGYFLTFNFQVSHVSTCVDWPETEKDEKTGKLIVDGEWAKLQVETCVDYGHDSILCRFWSGSLNYQSVHHLFPSVSQYHYPKIAPIIRDVCIKHDVKFNHIATFYEAFSMHIEQLYDMSFNPKKTE